ncbi:hypothetical protein like AT2G32885 [Hibiscus trionum]|uniref:Rapid ALkalinization Factor n=1 Tax=Hibiscus trionum TaxID=183268 RepID=A0A9W7LY17_HIBTR|nr:hypothetical protein like AT2G32885 [Hibiscus trionum]
MGVEKKMMILCICAMVVSSMLMEHGDANAQPVIGYPTMGRNLQKPCKHNFVGCLPPPSNDYNRGCEPSQRCRGGGAQEGDEPTKSEGEVKS